MSRTVASVLTAASCPLVDRPLSGLPLTLSVSRAQITCGIVYNRRKFRNSAHSRLSIALCCRKSRREGSKQSRVLDRDPDRDDRTELPTWLHSDRAEDAVYKSAPSHHAIADFCPSGYPCVCVDQAALMETYEGRLATFAAQPRRRHHPVPSSWPHGLDFSVTPATLAAAGFRYDPTPSGDDNVTCVYCSRGLEGWEEGDDALDEHLKRHDSFTGEQCPWATVMGAKRDYEAARSRGTSLATLEEPTTSRLENARRNTFGKWWTFDGKKNWKPTSGRVR